MEAFLSSTSVRLVGLVLLAAVSSFPPAHAQEPEGQLSCFAEFAGCKLCEYEDCEVIDCRGADGVGTNDVHVECSGDN